MKHAAKLALLARVVLLPAQWDANAAAWSRSIPADSPGDLSAVLKAEVDSGRAKVCHIEREGRKVGFIVFTATDRHELLVHAAFGRDGSNLFAESLAALESLARQCECETIRFHTMRPGLIVAAQAHGFRVSEVIIRKDVPHA